MNIPQGERISDALIERAKALSAATMHEASGRQGALPYTIRAIDPAMRCTGRALPVRCPAGDNLQLHLALCEAQPGDVLVVDCGEGIGFGYWGEIMATAAIASGIAGLVISGGVRDTLRLIELGLPTFAAATTVLGTGKDVSKDGAIGEPIRMGEIVVRRGDLLFGDSDGVVCFPASEAERVISNSEKRDADEAVIIEKLRNGARTIDVYRF